MFSQCIAYYHGVFSIAEGLARSLQRISDMSNHNQSKEDLSAWERVKAAMANDWEQTKSDFGSDSARDMNQDIDDTVKQAIGTKNAFENNEQAFRFGYTSGQKYGAAYPKWGKDIDAKLRSEYTGDYASDKRYIRHAYEYSRRAN